MSHGVAGRTKSGEIDSELARAVAERMQVLATPSRVQIIARLKQGACSVGELAADVRMEPSAVSHQLRQLRHLGLVIGERRGKRVIYGLHDGHDAAAPAHSHSHGHSHGLVHDSIKRSREGLRAVGLALLILGLTAIAQTAVFITSGSVALLADLIHNAGDAATAIPLGIAFALRSARAERWAGLAVVVAIFVSACVAGYEAVDRLINPQTVTALVPLALAGALGFAGN